MPTHYDHHKGAGGTPRHSVLSASAAKGLSRTPLTPKVASVKPPQAHVTPLAARQRKTDHSALNASTPRDDVASPVSAFLNNNNITPRSGHRQSRVDSASSTPTGTPNQDRLSDWDSRSGFESDHLKKHVVTFSPPSDVGSRSDASDAKFFYASDARPGQQQQQQYVQPKQHATPTPKPPTFLYANGSTVERTRPTSPGVTSPGFTPMLAPAHEAQPSKFFYANGWPDLQAPFRPPSSSGPGSVVSTSSKMATSRTATSTPAPGYIMTSPASPTKPQHPQLAAPPKAPTIVQQSRSPPLASPPQLGPPALAKRRVSIETSPRPSTHSRNGSVSSGDAMIMSKFMATQTPQASSEASSPALLPQNSGMTMASIIQAAEDFAAAESEESKEQSELQSPTKSHAGDPLNDLVANARRERKVQDLEITNASLEAINRSLERQLRKQTAELRRYRRLSRSGRLSMASVASARIPSDSTVGTAVTMEGLDLSDLSEEDGLDEEDEEEEEDDSMYDTDPSEAGSDPSPGLKAADRRRKRDEKRLQLDLSKHRELLVDSQKINQSIKRCLDWSEDLIKQGKKALEYTVRVSEVDLAPRVLRPQWEDDADDTRELSTLDVLEEEEEPEAGSAEGKPVDHTPASHVVRPDGNTDTSPPVSTMMEGANLAPPWVGDPPPDRDSRLAAPVDGG